MPFTNATLLANHIAGADKLLAGLTTDPFIEADEIITRWTGIEPPANVEEADKLLSVIASRIVIWHISGRAQGLPRDEWERRRAQYDEAMHWLEQIRDGTLSLVEPEATTGPQFRSDPLRGGNW